jgi:hypothetical protein
LAAPSAPARTSSAGCSHSDPQLVLSRVRNGSMVG